METNQSVYLIDEELGVRVLHAEHHLDIQLRFDENRWVSVDSYHEISNDYAYSSARNSFKYECEKRRKQIEDDRNNVRSQSFKK